MSKVVTKKIAVKKLGVLFRRNGYIRWLDSGRRKNEGEACKKGNEIRLVADSKQELLNIRRLLTHLQFKTAKPFAKANQLRQPVYGVAEVARFLELIGWSVDEDG